MANIMIADDSDAIRLVLKDILSIGNHTVVAEAIDGEEATDLFFKNSPDLLLLDLAMPKKDGLTVLTEIIEKNPQAKIVLITASDDQKIINQCLEIGATSCISKPFDFNSVLKQINDILG
ncbi:MAG: response regulator [Nitrosopumilus sp.]|jgi:two-component system chemotaxis response regulator CheY|uniref:Response regulator n=2 Tax=Candidatus Nitrosomaritimum aestuariumsis TaxID=3342354 RepID=A0AC60VWX0_9ARCH|nr:response regulator [Nitrosopumilaceae archaeon]MBA4459424.1 response regulator [Nitrosopumilaceae archaeon]MBA4462337.1 response regulator [Nitrosopumilaceae archaeon]MBA4464280.1 response regulator [Nitrosopumilaceae archaeon]